MATSHIDARRDGLVGVITINRPERFNSLDVTTAQDFRRSGLQFARDPQVRAVVVRGLPEMFCSGADLKFIRDGGDAEDLAYLTGAQVAQGAPGAQGAQPGPEGKDGSSGQQGSSAGGRDGVARLQREADEQMKDAQKLAEDMQRENPGMQKGGSTPEQWQRSVSAPGTEAFKQDFAKWESLKKNLMVALEQTESQLSDQLRARETRERLNAGRHDAVADTYRALVDRYYQSLAAPRRPNR